MRCRVAPVILAVVTTAGGCASSQGLSSDVLADVIRQEEARFLDVPAAGTPDVRVEAPTLRLYLKPTGHVGREFEWTTRDRDVLLAWSERVPLPPGGRSTGFLTPSSLRGQTLTELRTAAKRYGVDWLLIFDGAAAADRYNNYKAALLYWTIVGAYLVDGTHDDAMCLIKASLWDVKSGARLFEEQAEALTKSVGPAALIDEQREIDRARAAAMNVLLDRLQHRFRDLSATGR